MKLETFLAFSFLKGRKKNPILNKLFFIPVITISLSISISILTLSVLNGFHQSIYEKLIANDFHLKLHIPQYWNNSYIKKMKTYLKKDYNIKIVQGFFEKQGFLDIQESEMYPIHIKSFYKDEFNKNPFFQKHFTITSSNSNKEDYSFSFNKKSIIISESLNKFFINSNKVKIIIPSSIPFQYLSKKLFLYFSISKIYTSNFSEFNSNIAFISYDSLKEFGFKKHINYLGIILKKVSLKERTKKFIQQRYPNIYISDTLEKNIFKDLIQEKSLLLILLIILSSISGFTINILIKGSILYKQKEIFSLKLIGFSSNRISKIFLIQGIFTYFFSLIFGILLGISLTKGINSIIVLLELLINSFLYILFLIISPIFSINKPIPTFNIIDSSIFYMNQLPYLIKITDITYLCIILSLIIISKMLKRNITL